MTHISGGILPPLKVEFFPPWAKLNASCVHFPLCRRPCTWHTVMHHSSTSNYTPNFIRIWYTSCGWTDVCRYRACEYVACGRVVRKCGLVWRCGSLRVCGVKLIHTSLQLTHTLQSHPRKLPHRQGNPYFLTSLPQLTQATSSQAPTPSYILTTHPLCLPKGKTSKY